MYLLYLFPEAPHTYDFVAVTSLTHPRKLLLVVLQIRRAKDLSAPLHKMNHIKSSVNDVVLKHENIILLHNNYNVIYLISR
jgi:hypothetical protein